MSLERAGESDILPNATFHPDIGNLQASFLFCRSCTEGEGCFFAKQDIQITAIDISSSMISQAKEKVSTQMNIDFIEMDAQHLLFPDKSFDMIIANLILSVVPDANRCMQEIIRVTKEHGSIVVFDKFESRHKKLSFGKQLLRPIISILGTDIGRNFETMIEPFHKKVVI
ncbi:class I SAM-dependent methyltransferase [Brevibacterium sp. JNUCC-42]|nr:class I SAM-dependent methyltransferase [Brevibacterium sp. JNUCC-42]